MSELIRNARKYLRNRGYKNYADNSMVPALMVDFALSYCEVKVKELKEKADSRDKITPVDDHAADGSKPMIGSSAFPDQSNFISDGASQTPIGSMEGAKTEKVCCICGAEFIGSSSNLFCEECWKKI